MAKALINGTPWYFHVILIISIMLVLVGFAIPPRGEVDGSVLTAIGELMGGATLMNFVLNIPTYLEAGIKAKISHGDTSITVTGNEQKDNEIDAES